MFFAAIAKYTPDASVIAQARPAHRQYLTGLRDRNKLVISGPFADDDGAILVYEAETAEQADAMVREDPFAKHGVFLSWEIRPWNVIFRNENLLCGEKKR
ncbi:MAG TPA: YciI family protein [Bryobacteraceae bacterium]|nr:YciI family protein [Bryobacteraceae bacterium]